MDIPCWADITNVECGLMNLSCYVHCNTISFVALLMHSIESHVAGGLPCTRVTRRTGSNSGGARFMSIFICVCVSLNLCEHVCTTVDCVNSHCIYSF